MTQTSFLGAGWGFPPTFSKSGKGVEILEGEANIKSSLGILLSTRLGERVMLPKFGCSLDEMLFEPLTTTFKTYIKDLIQTAILYYEPRIDVEKIELIDKTSEGLIEIHLTYMVRSTNSRYNLVYPFYTQQT